MEHIVDTSYLCSPELGPVVAVHFNVSMGYFEAVNMGMWYGAAQNGSYNPQRNRACRPTCAHVGPRGARRYENLLKHTRAIRQPKLRGADQLQNVSPGRQSSVMTEAHSRLRFQLHATPVHLRGGRAAGPWSRVVIIPGFWGIPPLLDLAAPRLAGTIGYKPYFSGIGVQPRSSESSYSAASE